MPAITTRGAASAKAFGWSSGGGPGPYIEELFSTFLYTGNGSTQTITNGIDLSTKGGLTWIKSRSGTTGHRLTDTARGVTKSLASETTAAEITESTGLTAFGTTGFTIGADVDYNISAATYVSWTFRKQPKFCDVVTYTGDGAASRSVSHNLGSAPGFIIVKATSAIGDWAVWHRSTGGSQGYLNTTAAFSGAVQNFPSTQSSTTTFTVYGPALSSVINDSAVSYVAYLFAHNAGGFGLTGADNVISCGSFTTDATPSDVTVTLGFEPQLLIKRVSSAINNWEIVDNMRGMTSNSTTGSKPIYPDLTNAEAAGGNAYRITPTGFFIGSASLNPSSTNIYIAIRRGPMKVPTVGTSVFAPQLAVGDATASGGAIGFPADLFITAPTTGAGYYWYDRLRGRSSTSLLYLTPTTIGAESSASDNPQSLGQNTVIFPAAGGFWNSSGGIFSRLNFRRAPGFFDVVCYTGTGVATTVTHNLGVVPELIIVKTRDLINYSWLVYDAASGNTKASLLNTTGIPQAYSPASWNATSPTATVFSVGTGSAVNNNTSTYVAYLFATCAGVSKVGSYTGNGSNQTIACGFAAGSRFVMIKRTDSTGDWYVWDSARGIVAGNDPHLSLNDVAAEVTTDDSVDTDNSGFIVNQLAATNVNVTSATYMFLAIA